MRNFVVYHNSDAMGYPAIDVGSLAIYTKKVRSDAVGGRIWLIAGEGRPRVYKLRATFIVDAVGVSDKIEFFAKVSGKEGHLFYPMPALNAASWFQQFRKKQGNFAFGFQPINDSTVEDGLQGLLSSSVGCR